MPTQEPRTDKQMKLSQALIKFLYASTALINQVVRSGVSGIAN